MIDSPSPLRMMLRALTPKEFSEAIGGLLTPETIRTMCRRGDLKVTNTPRRVREHGRSVMRIRPPYYICPSELERYRTDLSRFVIRAA